MQASEQEQQHPDAYWDNRYVNHQTGWDIGFPSGPMKRIIDVLPNKQARILIPGCGNAYEADYLLAKGFNDITLIDIAPTLTAQLKEKFKGLSGIQIITGDFFEGKYSYDCILEQTFFCALPPAWRLRYVARMHRLLGAEGILCGVLFNKAFEGGPPYGGDVAEYRALFEPLFHIEVFRDCIDSIAPRAGNEMEIRLRKRAELAIYYCGAAPGMDTDFKAFIDRLPPEMHLLQHFANPHEVILYGLQEAMLHLSFPSCLQVLG